MKISEMINELIKIKNEHGDVEVRKWYGDLGYSMELNKDDCFLYYR